MISLNSILVPIDFSDNSREALKYAIDFLGPSSGSITLLYGYKVYSSSGMFISVEKLMKEDAEREMDLIMRHFQEKLPDHISLDFRIIRGEPVDTITAIAEEGAFDLVIMGTKGAGGLEEVFMGSTTGSVIKRINVPLMAIPSGYAFQSINHIILAADDEDYSSPGVFAPLLSIIDRFSSSLEVLHVGNEKAPSLQKLPDLLQNTAFQLVHKQDGNFSETLFGEVQTHDSRLIAMVRRTRGILSNLFHTSATLKTAFHSPVPLLILFE
jgi:nucleotide-binding universal stress UspA family protein